MSWPICRPQSPRCTSLTTWWPHAESMRRRLSPITSERRWPTWRGLATFGPPKSITIRSGVAALARPRSGSSLCACATSARNAADSRIFTKPGPASETSANSGRDASAAVMAPPISRGFRRSFLAAAMAPLHWRSARSGRSDTLERASSTGRSSAAKVSISTASIRRHEGQLKREVLETAIMGELRANSSAAARQGRHAILRIGAPERGLTSVPVTLNPCFS